VSSAPRKLLKVQKIQIPNLKIMKNTNALNNLASGHSLIGFLKIASSASNINFI
jgi:hypothetical protein